MYKFLNEAIIQVFGAQTLFNDNGHSSNEEKVTLLTAEVNRKLIRSSSKVFYKRGEDMWSDIRTANRLNSNSYNSVF